MTLRQCTIEIFIDQQWIECCSIEISHVERGGNSTAMLDYDINFVFSQHAAPVSLNYPANLDHHFLPHWPAFLFDLIPQGKGRRYLLGELGMFDQAAADWPLLCAGAFNPVGRLRVKEAVDFYARHLQQQNPAFLKRGFSMADILQRSEDFFEHLHIHGMLAAGTSCVQGVAPKFLITQGQDGLWYADGALPDAQAAKHWLVKLARGTDPSDYKILRNEAAYMRVAQAMGLAIHEAPEWQADMLFIPRFDRIVHAGDVTRLHQESVASLAGQIGFDARPTQNQILAALRQHCSQPLVATIEFLKRDILNLAMGNTDNHARNSAVQITPAGEVRLCPLFDFAPMYLDKEGIPRALRWRDGAGKELNNWADVMAELALPVPELQQVRQELAAFGVQMEQLEHLMARHGVDDDIINMRHHAIAAQIQQLQALSLVK